MLQNNKGFLLLDALYSLSLLLLLTLTLFPVLQIVLSKQYELETKRNMALSLHNELTRLKDSSALREKEITVNGVRGTITLEEQATELMGCIAWQTPSKGGEDHLCFYIPPKR
ncbi:MULTISPECIES: hypothetical protein [Pontibacillus]|uniref:Competence protein ComGE n=1 Tax=Pontibacillus chungwhensis TaxID=265426 RepID=A0ABY8UUD1_9BACI|nr:MULTISPECIES: hypothetical protein [Pontibacillus]MCD5323554.1 hypothetical protein [Pontibacillus sp. HN14]WIF96923.1 hypothetical protein QNI29_14360 [Pontibacillus chungwhensis]